MTQVAFHVLQSSRPRDRLQYLIHFLEQRLFTGDGCDIRLQDDHAVRRLDRLLWAYAPCAFLPHAPGEEAPLAPVRLWHDPATPTAGRCLVNLHAEIFPHFQGYEQVVELLDQDPQRLEAGRARFRRYRQEYGIVPAYVKVPQ